MASEIDLGSACAERQARSTRRGQHGLRQVPTAARAAGRHMVDLAGPALTPEAVERGTDVGDVQPVAETGAVARHSGARFAAEHARNSAEARQRAVRRLIGAVGQVRAMTAPMPQA